jgi:hypothetical protein
MPKKADWLQIYPLATHQVLWMLAGHKPALDSDVVRISSVPIQTAHDAQMVFTACRYRPQVERTCRFDREGELGIKEIRVRTLQRTGRLSALVLPVALFVHHVVPTGVRYATHGSETRERWDFPSACPLCPSVQHRAAWISAATSTHAA